MPLTRLARPIGLLLWAVLAASGAARAAEITLPLKEAWFEG